VYHKKIGVAQIILGDLPLIRLLLPTYKISYFSSINAYPHIFMVWPEQRLDPMVHASVIAIMVGNIN